jgi:hypothetical protein
LSEDYSFYWLNVPILLRPQRNWAFNRLEVAIEFNPGESETAFQAQGIPDSPRQEVPDVAGGQ